MSNINDIKELRKRTGAGMMECKNALNETSGDVEKAIEFLRKSGQAKAYKKSGRVATEGLVGIKQVDGKAAIVEVNCETDFVARDENFKNFVSVILDCVIEENIDAIDKLPTAKSAKMDNDIDSTRQALIAKVGENIKIRRLRALDSTDGSFCSYLHGGRIGVLLVYKGEESVAKDMAMQIAANNPVVIHPKDFPSELIEAEKTVLSAQALNNKYPQDKLEMIVGKQLDKFVNQSTLMGQPFVKDPKITVDDYLKQKATSVIDFIRYEVGEGLEKKEEDFVESVRAQLKDA